MVGFMCLIKHCRLHKSSVSDLWKVLGPEREKGEGEVKRDSFLWASCDSYIMLGIPSLQRFLFTQAMFQDSFKK